MDIEYDIIKTVRELQKQGYSQQKIEKNLLEMGYTQKQVDEIMDLSVGVDQAEFQSKAKKIFLVLIAGFVLLVIFMTVYALVLA